MLVQEASKVLGPGAYRGYLWRLEYDWEQPVGDHRLATWQPLALRQGLRFNVETQICLMLVVLQHQNRCYNRDVTTPK